MVSEIMNHFKKNQLIRSFLLSILLLGILPLSSHAEAALLLRGNPNLPYMSLTFDDGGSPEYVRSVLNTLEKYQVRATFFFVGPFIESNPELMKQLVAQGHEMGNHSYSHPEFTRISAQSIQNELAKTAAAFKNVTGTNMKPYVRPPYGAQNASVRQVLANAGYTHTVLWNVDTNDWRGKTTSQLINHVLSHAGNGNIVLMHTTKNSNAYRALPAMIEGLQKKGYQLVTISDLIANRGPSSTGLKPGEISQVEFLNNLLYTKTGTYYSSAEAIRQVALKYSIFTANETISYRALSRNEMMTYIKRAYPNQTDIENIFISIEFTKPNLSLMVQKWLSFSQR